MASGFRCIAFLASLGAVAGCGELSSYDDPRERPRRGGDAAPPIDATPSGTCTGVAVECRFRTVDECEGGGCAVEDGCYSPALERCSSHQDEGVCEADEDCIWFAGAEVCADNSLCTTHRSETSCLEDEYETCEWGPSCAGDASICFFIEDPEACGANLGCAWESD